MSERTSRERIVAAAADLLTEGGREAVSTRSVCAAAGVQAPTIYRLFGDKQGLLDAVASHGFATYLTAKTARRPSDDPLRDLRHGWDLHVEFGVANPAYYTLMYGQARPGAEPPAAREAAAILRGLVHRVAEAGLLRVPVERAAQMIHSAGCGVTLTLIATEPRHRDPELSPLTREAVLAAVTIPASGEPEPAEATGSPARGAISLLAALAAPPSPPGPSGSPGSPGPPGVGLPLSAAERGLLTEWLQRIADPEKERRPAERR
ncbi:TetR/AcrR family transcriptional regulator [Nonomuraea cavernae]|uniref:TetR/AcrR family transcriptional regulator n=1 Tax=Nonomuraea cavernae TaxID=2045107 RepID=UPI001666DC60|nr:TetR/AcrR family transcriptional regulator [Nonomuraea cavernae]MCA2185789.1 TetR/AcrR family transcriptional regulator [Nonomuraea cavernae]